MFQSRHAVSPANLARGASVAHSVALMEAIVAACSLIAHADGEVAPSERRRTITILRANSSTAAFSRGTVAAEIAEHEANFRLDPEVAQQIAGERLAAIGGQPSAADLVIAACRQIIPADGIAHPAEYRALTAIKALLGVETRAPSWQATRVA